MSSKKGLTIQMVSPPGADGFWPRENYFGGETSNGFALRLRPEQSLRLQPGMEITLVVRNHLPHLPYIYDGNETTLAAGQEVALLFSCRGKTRLLDSDEVEKYVQHSFDPTIMTETRDEHGLVLRQQGRKWTALLYEAELKDRE